MCTRYQKRVMYTFSYYRTFVLLFLNMWLACFTLQCILLPLFPRCPVCREHAHCFSYSSSRTGLPDQCILRQWFALVGGCPCFVLFLVRVTAFPRTFNQFGVGWAGCDNFNGTNKKRVQPILRDFKILWIVNALNHWDWVFHQFLFLFHDLPNGS